jgi:endogenous inhibitor of DNA gyrase (YacG/DUF329 family)
MPIYKTYSCLYCGKLNEKKPNTMGKYCSRKCQGDDSKQKNIEEWLLGKKNIKRSLIKEWLTKEYDYKCNVCGINEWNNKSLTLWVDHIDGDASNNKSSNFQLICPNCDSQQDTFGGKNYGKGRKSRGLPQYG